MLDRSLHLTFNGVNEEDLVWLSASWNLSYVEKYPQCIDSIQVLVPRSLNIFHHNFRNARDTLVRGAR